MASEWTSFVAPSIYAYRLEALERSACSGSSRCCRRRWEWPRGTAFADRTQREFVLLGAQLARAATLGAAATVLASGGAVARRLPARCR